MFVDYLSWRWIFYINVPVGIAATILIISFLHEHQPDHAKKDIDYLGTALFTVAMGSLLYALISGGESYAWNSATIIVLFSIALVFSGIFLAVELKAKNPI